MKRVGLIVSVLVLAAAAPEARASKVENPQFAYTHMQPSPFTLPAGRLVYGTELAFGLTDFLQVGTNILRDFFRMYNANAKLSLVDYPSFAFGLTGGFEYFNYKNISSSNPDFQVTSYLPGAVAAFALLPRVALVVAGSYSITNVALKTDGIVTSGYMHGISTGADISWAYNPPKSGKGEKGARAVGNVACAGVTYDVSFKVLGIGASHHWPGFHIGIHYYPNASQHRFLPILAGGGAVDF